MTTRKRKKPQPKFEAFTKIRVFEFNGRVSIILELEKDKAKKLLESLNSDKK